MQPHIFPDDKPQALCPLVYFRDNPAMEGKAFTLHLHWSNGILPNMGGLDDQAAIFNDVIIAVDVGVKAGRERLQEMAQKKAEMDARTKSGKGRKPR